jgi:hemerythrin-like metal-binding protein
MRQPVVTEETEVSMGPLPSWDDSYATGDPVIDLQHRDLLALVAALDQVEPAQGDKEFFRVLDRVLDFTWVHFEMEERLMSRVGYPAADHAEMTNQHTEFKDYARVRTLELRFSQQTALGDFAPFLQEWLVGHEFGLDRKLATFIRETRQQRTAQEVGEESKANSARGPDRTY